MKIERAGETIVITLPIEPKVSSSGKSLLIASTNGNKETELIYDGKKIIVGVNAFIPKD